MRFWTKKTDKEYAYDAQQKAYYRSDPLAVASNKVRDAALNSIVRPESGWGESYTPAMTMQQAIDYAQGGEGSSQWTDQLAQTLGANKDYLSPDQLYTNWMKSLPDGGAEYRALADARSKGNTSKMHAIAAIAAGGIVGGGLLGAGMLGGAAPGAAAGGAVGSVGGELTAGLSAQQIAALSAAVGSAPGAAVVPAAVNLGSLGGVMSTAGGAAAGGAAAGGGGLLSNTGSLFEPALKAAGGLGNLGSAIGAVGGGLLGATQKAPVETRTAQIDPRMANYLYGANGTSGMIGGVNDLWKKQMAQGGLNDVQREGLNRQLATLRDPRYSQGFDAMRSSGLGLLGMPIAGNPYTQR